MTERELLAAARHTLQADGAPDRRLLCETLDVLEARLLRASAPPADVARLRSERPRAHRAINALRTPDRALATVANTVRQSIAEVIAELLTEVYQAADALAALAQERDRLRAALGPLLHKYVEMALSGDCGYWDPEKEIEVINARAALGDSHE